MTIKSNNRRIIVIGASAGGVDALKRLVSYLPAASGSKDNAARPAIDPLARSAACSFGPAATGPAALVAGRLWLRRRSNVCD